MNDGNAVKTKLYPGNWFYSEKFPFAIKITENSSNEFNTGKRFRREFWKIVFILEGEGSFIIGNRSYPIRKGSLLVVHPAAITTYDIKDSSIKLCNIIFARSFIAGDFPQLSDTFHFLRIFAEEYSQEYESPLFLLTATREMNVLLNGIYREFNGNAPDREALIKLRFYELLLLIVRRSGEKGFRNPRWTADYVREYINKNYLNPFSQKGLAAELGLSPERLCRIYRQYYGKTIMSELKELRLARAAELLRVGRKSPKEAAAASGFTDLNHFYRSFTAKFNIPPEKYKQSF